MYVYFNNTTKTFMTDHTGEYVISSNPLNINELKQSMNYMYADHEIEPVHESHTDPELRKYLAEM